MRTKSLGLVGSLVFLVLASVSCGEEPRGSEAQRARSGETSLEDQVYEGTGLVLDDEGTPVLCLGLVNESLPPQCDGPELRRWSWEGLEYDEAGGTRWGTFTVRGTYVDEVFTLEGEPVEPKPFEGNGDSIDAPCPEPPEGWPMPDPAETTEKDRLTATRAAESQPDFAGVWIDYIVEPTTEEEGQSWGENIVLVLAFTGDPEGHEAQAREHWGGALCVWVNDRTYEQLEEIQGELGSGWPEELGIETTFSDIDVISGTVEIGVIVGTPEFETELEERYGRNAVEVQPALRPID